MAGQLVPVMDLCCEQLTRAQRPLPQAGSARDKLLLHCALFLANVPPLPPLQGHWYAYFPAPYCMPDNATSPNAV